MPLTKTKYFTLLLLLVLGIDMSAQQGAFNMNHNLGLNQFAKVDSLPLDQTLRPKKATLLAAVLPGSGQIYNKKYWKAPIVWGGMALCVYFISDNTKNYNTYSTAYIAELDGDPNTVNSTEFNVVQLDQLQETYRRWRDLSYVSLAAVYLLQMLDANVDAHLFYFDVNEDLSMHLTPWLNPNMSRSAGLSLNFNF